MVAGGATVTVFSSGTVVPAGTVPCTTIDRLVRFGRSTRMSIEPTPLAGRQTAPPAGVQVQVKAASGAGSASTTRAPETLLGPLFRTSISYLNGCPAM